MQIFQKVKQSQFQKTLKEYMFLNYIVVIFILEDRQRRQNKFIFKAFLKCKM